MRQGIDYGTAADTPPADTSVGHPRAYLARHGLTVTGVDSGAMMKRTSGFVAASAAGALLSLAFMPAAGAASIQDVFLELTFDSFRFFKNPTPSFGPPPAETLPKLFFGEDISSADGDRLEVHAEPIEISLQPTASIDDFVVDNSGDAPTFTLDMRGTSDVVDDIIAGDFSWRVDYVRDDAVLASRSVDSGLADPFVYLQNAMIVFDPETARVMFESAGASVLEFIAAEPLPGGTFDLNVARLERGSSVSLSFYSLVEGKDIFTTDPLLVSASDEVVFESVEVVPLPAAWALMFSAMFSLALLRRQAP